MAKNEISSAAACSFCCRHAGNAIGLPHHPSRCYTLWPTYS